MKKIISLLILILIFQKSVVYSQHIKVDNGILFSSYDNSKNLPILYDKVATYSVSLGADYLEKKWYYLSSQIGYTKLGGKEENPFLADNFKKVKQTKNYVHLNTTFRAFKELSSFKIFVGAGPYLNILTGSSKFNNSIYHDFYDLKTFVGGKGEIGLTHDINKVRIGLIGTYMMNLSPTGSSSALNLRNNNLGAIVSLGYSLGK